MPDEKTLGNRQKTVSNQEIAAKLDTLIDAVLDLHNDLRKVVAFVEDNAHTLSRAKSLLDRKLPSVFGGGRRG